MRLLSALLLCLLLTACSAPTPAPVLDRPVVAERLIRASLTERLLHDASNHYRGQVLAMLESDERPTQQLAQLVDEELTKIGAAEHDRLVQQLIPIYLKYFSADELQALMDFYETPVAKKLLQVSSQIAADSQPVVVAWSEQFGETLLANIDARLSAGAPAAK